MSKCYVVVEPHADDAFLSVGSHIERWVKTGNPVRIVTLFPVERGSLRDARDYAALVGAVWNGLELPGAGEPISDAVARAVRNYCPKGSQWILPLGVAPVEQNPHTRDHEDVRARFETPGCWYYVDQPYAIIQKHSERVTEKLKDMRMVSYIKPGANKWKRGVPIFRSQAKFFHFNEGNLPKTFELLVRK